MRTATGLTRLVLLLIVWRPAAGPLMKKVIHAYITPEDDGFRAQCFEPCLVTHAESLQEAVNGIQQAIGLHLAGGNLHQMGFAPEPKIVIAFFLGPLRLVAQ